jgi:hypothetical protein
VTGATGAYGLRRLKSTATLAIRVRRSNDNVEADIGFTLTGDLDQGALLTHCGANSGFIVTLYDQTGNSRHFTQATSTLQPRIVNSGVVDKKNNKPTLVFDGSDDRLSGVTATLGLSNGIPGASILSVSAPSAISANTTLLMLSTSVSSSSALINQGYSATNRFRSVIRRVSSDSANITTSAANNAFTSGTLLVHTLTITYPTSPLVTVYKDGVSNYTGSTGITAGATTTASDSVAVTLGSNTDATSPFTGSLSELIFYPSALSDPNRQAVEANQKAYFGTA